jgi:hypothetical protein
MNSVPRDAGDAVAEGVATGRIAQPESIAAVTTVTKVRVENRFGADRIVIE